MRELEQRISECVAEALNQENFDGLRENLLEIMESLSPGERERQLDEARIFVMHTSFPGCMPESSSFYPDGEDMRKIVLDDLEELDFDEEDKNAALEATIDSIRTASEERFRSGFSVYTPDGMVTVVSLRGCGEFLRLNDAYPDMSEPASGPGDS